MQANRSNGNMVSTLRGALAALKKKAPEWVKAMAIACALAGVSESALALDLSAPVCGLVTALTGKWVFGVSVLGMIGTIFMMVWGAEIGETMKKLVMVGFACFLIINCVNLVTFFAPTAQTCSGSVPGGF